MLSCVCAVRVPLLALGAGLLTALGAPGQNDNSSLPQPYTRIIESSPRHYRIEVASRRFEAPGKPTVWLAGMVHDGSPDFFLKVQDFLKTQPLVLLEDDNNTLPNPPGADASDDEKKKWTKQALNYAGELVEGYRTEFTTYPDSLDSVLFALEPTSEWAFSLRTCMTDAWGHAITYKKTDHGYELQSGGPGDGTTDPDLTVTHTPFWQWTDIDENRSKHSDSLGLLDQSNGGLTFDHPNFLFCDMLATEYKRRLKALPREGSDPYFANKNAPLTFDVKKYAHDVQVQRFKILEAAGESHIPQVLDAKGEVHLTIIERNDVVWAEISRRIAASQPVCALYGAAHLYDLETRLVGEGYTPAETRWLPVFEADLTQSKITDAEIAEIQDDARSGRMGYY